MASPTIYVRRSTNYVLGMTHRLPLTLDAFIGLALFLTGLYIYTVTLAPTVLEGDGALFQYTPHVLGVTYPTGFPLYILIGKLWLLIFPVGEVAWRMNFLSAFCSALTLPLLYSAARHLLGYVWLSGEIADGQILEATTYPPGPPEGGEKREIPPSGGPEGEKTNLPPFGGPEGEKTNLPPFGGLGGSVVRWAALTTTLAYATLPTFWLWSTGTKTYALNILLFTATLYLLAAALTKQFTPAGRRPTPPAPRTTQYALRPLIATSPLLLPALLLGLQISVHNTAVLLLPGLFLFAWLHFRPYLRRAKTSLLHLILLALPGLFYLYIPLRAEWLIARYGRTGAIERGLLADFYHSGWAGLLRYYTAADFTGGVVTNWGQVPAQFFSRYLPILTDNFTGLGVGLALIGGLALAFRKPRIFWPLFLIYATPIPFVLAYGQGEQSAFLLPSFLIVALFLGHTLPLTERIVNRNLRFTIYDLRFTAPLIFLILTFFLFVPQIRYSFNWLDVKWSRPIYEEWSDNLNHPLEPGATVLARWGDLTSFWYMQHVEQRRPDLLGLYPPTEETVIDWFRRGGENLYIAGPLESWASGVEARYQLLPWGRLVRIAPRKVDPATLLPDLPRDSQAVFNDQLRLISFDHASQVTHGSIYPVTLTWQALADLPPETTVSLRLTQGEAIITQVDDALLSGWFPRDTLPSSQYVLNYARLPIPVGTLPGTYNLQLVAYTSYKQPWALADGSILLDLGQVEVTLPAPSYQPDLELLHPLPRHDFNGEIKLAHYEYTARRVGQGKGFAIKLLWQALQPPVDNYTVRVEALDSDGNLIRSVDRQPTGGQAPTATWQRGQFVRDQIDIVLPASTPPGQDALRLRLSWLRPDGSRLTVRRWSIPLGETLPLDTLTVTEKEDRLFEVPAMAYEVGANLENRARLLGYDGSTAQEAGEPVAGQLQLNQTLCQAQPESCRLELDVYWQGLSEMDQLYYVFLHVVDEAGQLVAQHDRPPGIRGKQPTTTWLPGEVVTDPISLNLPPDLSPGEYSLHMGLYLHPDGPRLFVLDEEGQAIADSVVIGRLAVLP